MLTPTTKKATYITSISAFIAGLCCFSPVVIVLLGLGTTSFAGSLADTLYGEYKWYFRSAGVGFLAAAYGWWYYTSSKGCSLNEQKRLRSKLFNLFLLSIIGFILLYTIWLYLLVDLFGVLLNIW